MDTASLVLVVLRLSEVKNKHTVSQSPVLNVSVKPCWLTTSVHQTDMKSDIRKIYFVLHVNAKFIETPTVILAS